MVQRLLLAGMLSGLLVALFAFSFARVYAEPTIERAISLEERGTHEHEAAKAGAISRSTQRNAGLLTGLAAYCTALGGLLAIGLACVHGRLSCRPQSAVWTLASAGYVALVLVPQLKYPANPPGVGSAETIAFRTELYFVVIMAAAMCMAASAWMAYRTRLRTGQATMVLIGIGMFVPLAGLLMAMMPAIAETPHDFPRGLLFEFRVHAALLQLIVWGGLGALFGQAAEYVVQRDSRMEGVASHEIPNA
ncbi:CbtA family protein [Rhizobium sp. NZLR1b]|uniref:CbtA family protein n=1 Tax=Rhizobium sp. NZLR1b TaxID=2731099 RepID=UPI001C832B62|nr:CbtA family protein [Rhizobium sp. NZLR1b]MBX5170343.1 CbtA family protein [Rhizobium sp. NZLR1b]